jgi:hypothetical protein
VKLNIGGEEYLMKVLVEADTWMGQ